MRMELYNCYKVNNKNADEYDFKVQEPCPIFLHGVAYTWFRWQSNDALGLILGCVCCMFLAFLMMAMPEIKRKLLKSLESSSRSEGSIITDGGEKSSTYEQLNFKQKVANVFVCILHAFLHVVIMVIIMNMNFYVILAFVIGASLGYVATSQEYCAKK